MTHSSKTAPHPVDLIVGVNIRRWRHARDMTQQQLASEIGVKFQQLQKYETAANRVAASRLHMLASALRCEIADFFVQHNDPRYESAIPEIFEKARRYDHLVADAAKEAAE